MPGKHLDVLTVVMAAATFGLVLSLWFSALLMWHARRSVRAKALQRRLGLAKPEDEASAPSRVLRLWRDGKEVSTTVPGSSLGRFAAWCEKMRSEAGWETPLQTLAIGLAGTTFLTFAAVLATTSSFLIALLAAFAVVQLFWIFLGQTITRRKRLFERQLVDALELAARSLRVGHPLVGSFQLIAEEIAAPVGTVFSEVVQQQGLGMPLDEAIRRAARTHGDADLKLFATSVVIQIRSGGNLADMMERLSAVMRERLRLARRVRVLTAQTQFSKNVLLALPIVVFVGLNVLNPAYMSVLYDTGGGRTMLAIAAGGLIVGAWLMNRLSQLQA